MKVDAVKVENLESYIFQCIFRSTNEGFQVSSDETLIGIYPAVIYLFICLFLMLFYKLLQTKFQFKLLIIHILWLNNPPEETPWT